MNIAQDFLQHTIAEFRKYKQLGDKAIFQLREQDLHWQPNEESNSIAVIIRHLYGNMKSRFTDFLTTDGEKPDRHRDEEFIDKQESRAELIEKWNQGWQFLFDTLASLSEGDLNKTVTIRTEPHTVVQAIIRQLSHYCGHVGQIIYLAKQIKSNDWKTLSIPRGKSEEFNQFMKSNKA